MSARTAYSESKITVYSNPKINKNSSWALIKRNKFIYFLLLPACLATFIFQYLPLLGITIAFQNFSVTKGFFDSPWVGFNNFITIFTFPQFGKAVLNTLKYSSVILFGGFGFPILLAILINEIRVSWFKRAVQTISYLPYFLSWIAVVGMFYSFLSLDGTYNDIMMYFRGSTYQRVNILMNADQFLGIMFSSHLWKNMGWSSVIFIAAISGIDPTLYEASIIDGCGRFKQIIHITVPGIMTTVMIVFIMALGSLVSTNFEQVFGFQNIYTQEQTEVINTLIYRKGVLGGEYSLTTAFGLAQGVVSLLLVTIANQISKKISNISIW